MESGEEIRYGIEEAVVRLLTRTTYAASQLRSALSQLSGLRNVKKSLGPEWLRKVVSQYSRRSHRSRTRLRAWLILATLLKRSILPFYPTPPLQPSHSPA